MNRSRATSNATREELTTQRNRAPHRAPCLRRPGWVHIVARTLEPQNRSADPDACTGRPVGLIIWVFQ